MNLSPSINPYGTTVRIATSAANFDFSTSLGNKLPAEVLHIILTYAGTNSIRDVKTLRLLNRHIGSSIMQGTTQAYLYKCIHFVPCPQGLIECMAHASDSIPNDYHQAQPKWKWAHTFVYNDIMAPTAGDLGLPFIMGDRAGRINSVELYELQRNDLLQYRQAGLDPWALEIIGVQDSVENLEYRAGPEIDQTVPLIIAIQIVNDAADQHDTGVIDAHRRKVWALKGSMPWTEVTDLNDLKNSVRNIHFLLKAFLESPTRRKSLRLAANTNHERVLYGLGTPYEQPPKNNKLVELDFTYVGQNMFLKDGFLFDSEVLCHDLTRDRFANVPNIWLSGVHLHGKGQLNMSPLDLPNGSPAWSHLCKLELEYVKLNRKTVAYLKALPIHISFRHAIWEEGSMAEFCNGSRLTGVKVWGIQVVIFRIQLQMDWRWKTPQTEVINC